jgi:superfamily II DNA or RNA helicase
MSLAALASEYFPLGIQARGEHYFLRGRVRINRSTDDRVEAVVRGTELYGVEITLTGPVLGLHCSCPYFLAGSPCKHLWATLLAADQQQVLQPPADITELEVDWSQPGGPARARADQEEEPAPLLKRNLRPPAAYAPPPRPPPSPPLWQLQLSTLGHAAMAPSIEWSREHQVRYVLKTQASYRAARQLQVELQYCMRKKSGAWNKPKLLRLAPEDLDLVGDEQDRRLLAMLVGAADPYGYASYKTPAVVALRSRAQAELLVPLLIQTGRCLVRPADNRADVPLTALDPGAPWLFRARVQPAAKKDQFILSGRFERGDVTLDLLQPLVLPFGWLVWEGTAARLEDGGALALLEALREARNHIVVPAADADALLQRLVAHGRLPALTLPAEWQVREETHVPRFRLVVGRAQQHWLPELLPARCSADYDGLLINPDDPADVCFDPGRRRLLRRDGAAERRALTRLKDLGVKRVLYPGEWPYQIKEAQLSAAVCGLLAEGWHVEAQGRPYRRGGLFNMTVRTGTDWFELHGAMHFDGQTVPLPALLAALQKNEPLVKLGDGSFGILPEDWLERYGRFVELGTAEGDHLRFKRNQAGLLDALLAAQPEATCDKLFAGVRKELESFTTIQPVAVPAEFRGTLRAYQHEGLNWLHFLRRVGFGGCLADDMGLGKTIQVLALLEARRVARASGHDDAPRPSLVVAPRSLIFNWMAEAARFTPRLRLLAHTGTERHATTETLANFDVILTTYGTLRNDIAYFKDFAFDCVILDEAQAIKNASTTTTKATRLLQARQRLALSGTPVQNHLGELWSLFEFLNPGMLGAASVFRLATAEPDEATRALLSRALRPFILRRTKAQVAKDLPERTEETIFCELEDKQRRLYNELREHYRQSLLARVDRDGLAKSKMHVLEALLRLRQAACHPGLIEKERAAEPSAKLDALLPQLEEVLEENHKALVFSQFTSLLSLVRRRLDAAGMTYEYLDGQTQDRAACVRRFQEDPDCKLFLISLKAGGLGLNLTAAEYVFLLDPWWNPAIEAQAIDRAHRIGQKQRVFAYRLIARDTVEEKILELQKTKRALADAIIGAENSLLGGLQRQDLELLLS